MIARLLARWRPLPPGWVRWQPARMTGVGLEFLTVRCDRCHQEIQLSTLGTVTAVVRCACGRRWHTIARPEMAEAGQ